MSDRDILRPLVDEIAELASDPREAWKRELWARHQALLPTEKIPVCVSYEGIPGQQWDFMFGRDHLRTSSPLAREIEFDLKRRIWMARNVPDDHIVWPFITVQAVTEQVRDWGVPLEWHAPEEKLGAKQIVSPFADGIDMSRLTEPRAVVDMEATGRRVEEAEELVAGEVAVLPRYPHMGHSPFETVVRLRGMQRLLMDVMERPEAVHAMMEFVTAALVKHHLLREERGCVNALVDASGRYHVGDFMRVNASYLAEDFGSRPPKLSDEWAYVSAQSAAGLGPAMFEEFVHQYHTRLAHLYTNGTVYYHGCERLDEKMDCIATLPHLRRFHVSPWSSVSKARETFRGSVVLEVHCHPGKVFFAFTPEDMRSEIEDLVARAEGAPMDLNLSDIHSIDGKPDALSTWAQVAQDVVAKARG